MGNIHYKGTAFLLNFHKRSIKFRLASKALETIELNAQFLSFVLHFDATLVTRIVHNKGDGFIRMVAIDFIQ